MRWKLVVGVSVVTLGVGFAALWKEALSTFGIRMWEERPHAVVVDEGAFEIRAYEPVLVATTDTGGKFGPAMGEGFGRLAGYIFGGNASDQSIAMTMPVEMAPSGGTEGADDAWRMSFFLPAAYERDELPSPDDGAVRVEAAEGETLAVFRYSGIGREADIAVHEPGLRAWLEGRGYEAVGPARLALYDTPWSLPFLRRNEVVIPVAPR